MSDLFDGPEVNVVPTPSEEVTDAEIAEQKKKEQEALGAFFTSLRQGGAEELRSPTSTGLNL